MLLATVPADLFLYRPDPVILPDDQYPEWLWELTKPRPTLAELNHKFEHDRDNLSLKDWHYMIRYWPAEVPRLILAIIKKFLAPWMNPGLMHLRSWQVGEPSACEGAQHEQGDKQVII